MVSHDRFAGEQCSLEFELRVKNREYGVEIKDALSTLIREY